MGRKETRAFLKKEARTAKKIRSMMVNNNIRYIVNSETKESFFEHVPSQARSQVKGDKASEDVLVLLKFIRKLKSSGDFSRGKDKEKGEA